MNKETELKPIPIRLSPDCHALLEYIKFRHKSKASKAQIIRDLCEKHLPGIVLNMKQKEILQKDDPEKYHLDQIRKKAQGHKSILDEFLPRN